MARVRLENIVKKFDDTTAVDELTIQVKQGEFFSLLGPSGCGKTTTLRMIAGFEPPTSGKIFFDDRDVTHLRPQDRNVGMVFQNYALFAHLSVGENVAFGLKARKIEKSEITVRVKSALAKVELQHLIDRPVSALSGGQQQRVALARALVIEPQILLLDEPLSNLDAKLRVETREHIRHLQESLGITTFYVTHDQEEALTQSDRMAVFFDGKCVQIGSPREIFDNPNTEKVMGFLGKANILTAKNVDQNKIQFSENWHIQTKQNLDGNSTIRVGFRPNEIRLFSKNSSLSAEVKKVVYVGSDEEVTLKIDDIEFVAHNILRHDTPKINPGDKINFDIPVDALHFW